MTLFKRFGLTIAATLRNEGPYLAEWIEYHGLIGVEHFYLYDNDSTDETAAVLRDYVIQGRVTLLSWPEFPGQDTAYNHALKIFGRDSEWMALIDADEFLLVEDGRSVPEILATLEAVDQVLMPWVHFGNSGHEEKPPGLVIESYVHRVDESHLQPKSLVRPDAVLWAEVHHCVTRSGRTADSSGRALPESWILEQPPEGVIRVNHYFTKSRAEFAVKLARGQADGGHGKTMDSFARFHCPVEDRRLAAMGPAIRDALQETAARAKQSIVHATWSAQSEIAPSRVWTLRAQAALKALRALLTSDVILGLQSDAELEQVTLKSGSMPPLEPTFAGMRDLGAMEIADLPLDTWHEVGSTEIYRHFLALAGDSMGGEIQVELEGEDAGGKPFAARRSIELAKGASVTFALLSERTMRLNRVRMTSNTPITALHAEVIGFR